MAGYTRQSSAEIVTGEVIEASDLNNEYDQLVAAFSNSTGHSHDGTSAEGARITVFGPGGIIASSASAMYPSTDDAIDLGIATTNEFRNLYIDGTAFLDAVDIDGGTMDGVVIGGASAAAGSFTTLGASGAATLSSTLGVTGAATFSSTVGVTGALTASGGLGVTGNITVTGTVDGRDVAADGMKLDGVEASADVTDATNVAAAGAVMDGDFSTNGLMIRSAAGTYLTRSITGTANEITVTNGDGVAGAPTLSLPSTMSFAGKTIADLGNVTTADINGGTLDGVTIGGSTPGAGTFAGLTATGTLTLSGVTNKSTVRSDLGLAIGTDVQAYDADTLKADTNDTLTAKFTETPITDSSSSGSVTLDFTGRSTTEVTLTENITTVTLTGLSAGDKCEVWFKQAAGNYTVSGYTHSTMTIKWTTGGNAAPVAPQGAGEYMIVQFRVNQAGDTIIASAGATA